MSTGGVEVHVVIASKDPAAIAAALAGAFLDNRDSAEQIVVWAYSDAALVGTAYDRGVVSEQGTLGEGLVFEARRGTRPKGKSAFSAQSIRIAARQTARIERKAA